jgi:hypothetical protein
MYAAVPETVGQSGPKPAAVRDGNNITSNLISTVAGHTANTLAKNIASNPAHPSRRSAAR